MLSNMKFTEMPEIFQTIARGTREIFLKQGEYRPTVFAEKNGALVISDVGMLMNSQTHNMIAEVMITFVKMGSPFIAMASEAWGVQANESNKDEMLEAAERRQLHVHPARVEVINIICEDGDGTYVVSAEIKRDPLRLMPWKCLYMNRADMVKMRDLGGARYNDIFRKAGVA
jgi:hypothetical protein